MIANLFLLGAPKSGTTAVAASLGRHPDIFLPHVKEPHYFGTDTGEATADGKAYEVLFKNAGKARYRLDASTHSLRSKDALEQIIARVPDARFIVLLRDPVEAVPAFHSQLLKHFVEPETDFEAAWKLQVERESGKLDGPLYHPVFDYGRQIERLASLVPEDRYRIYAFTELKADGDRVIREILEFLDVDPIALELSRDNVNTEHKFRALHRQKQKLAPKVRRLKMMLGIQKNLGLGKLLLGWNGKAKERKPLAPHIVEELGSRFADDCEKVQEITGIDIRRLEKS